jgi:Zn-dependent oligopeptidase
MQLDLHTKDRSSYADTTDIVSTAFSRYGTFPFIHGLSEQHNLWHLANPGYASLYYCYLYSRVISHDLFSEFVKSGDLMNKDVAKKYRKMVLENGSSKEAGDMVNSFLGREFNAEAYKDWLKAPSRPGIKPVDAGSRGQGLQTAQTGDSTL